MNRKYDKLIEELYIELYKHATPPADFKELLRNAKVECVGGKNRRVILYDDYYLSHEDFEKIIGRLAVKYKLNAREIEGLKFEAYLGATPSSKLKNKTNDNSD